MTDRSRSAGRKLRTISRTVARRTGEAKATVLGLTGEAGELVKRSVREARRLATRPRERARGRGAQAKLAAAGRLDELAGRAERIARQIDRRPAGEKISDRLVSIFDADARPIRKGKLRAPTEFGYVFQLAEITENTRRGARGLLLPAATALGNPTEDTLLASTADELKRLGLTPRDFALDGGFNPGPTATALPDAERVFIAGRQSTGSRHSDRRLAKYRVGCEGRISHLKRRYGARRARLKGHRAPKRRSAGAPSPTTSTRSPSAPPDRIPTAPELQTRSRFAPRPRPKARPCSCSARTVYPGQVASDDPSRPWRSSSTPSSASSSRTGRRR